MSMRRLRYCLLGGLLVTIAACSAAVRKDETIPPETYSDFDTPLRFVASRLNLSVVGKDYLFMAPVIVSRNGQSQSYLWFALGSTVDRPITGAPDPTFSAIVVDLDGRLMTFDLVPWEEIARADPFVVAVNTRASYGAKATRSQLNRIAAAEEIHAFVTNARYRSPRYELAGDVR